MTDPTLEQALAQIDASVIQAARAAGLERNDWADWILETGQLQIDVPDLPPDVVIAQLDARLDELIETETETPPF